MSTNKLFAILAAGGFLLMGSALMITNENKLQEENNAFAKDCNDRGGVAYFFVDSRQCLNAKLPPRS
jgi:hypothetical protein